jgi:hypothetical protein
MKAVKDGAQEQYGESVDLGSTGKAPLTETEIRVLETLVRIQESIKGILWPRKYGREARYITPEKWERWTEEFHRERAVLHVQARRQDPDGCKGSALTEDTALKLYLRYKWHWFPQVPNHRKHPILSLLFLSPAVFVFALLSPHYRKYVGHILYLFWGKGKGV